MNHSPRLQVATPTLRPLAAGPWARLPELTFTSNAGLAFAEAARGRWAWLCFTVSRSSPFTLARVHRLVDEAAAVQTMGVDLWVVTTAADAVLTRDRAKFRPLFQLVSDPSGAVAERVRQALTSTAAVTELLADPTGVVRWVASNTEPSLDRALLTRLGLSPAELSERPRATASR